MKGKQNINFRPWIFLKMEIKLILFKWMIKIFCSIWRQFSFKLDGNQISQSTLCNFHRIQFYFNSLLWQFNNILQFSVIYTTFQFEIIIFCFTYQTHVGPPSIAKINDQLNDRKKFGSHMNVCRVFLCDLESVFFVWSARIRILEFFYRQFGERSAFMEKYGQKSWISLLST